MEQLQTKLRENTLEQQEGAGETKPQRSPKPFGLLPFLPKKNFKINGIKFGGVRQTAYLYTRRREAGFVITWNLTSGVYELLFQLPYRPCICLPYKDSSFLRTKKIYYRPNR